MDAGLYKICRYSMGLLFRITMYKIAMRTGRKGQIVYAVQEEIEVFGVKKWKNIQVFSDYDSAKKLYNQLSSK